MLSELSEHHNSQNASPMSGSYFSKDQSLYEIGATDTGKKLYSVCAQSISIRECFFRTDNYLYFNISQP